MRTHARVVFTAVALCFWASLAHGDLTYPLNVTLDARAKSAATTINSSVTFSVERLMEESRRMRVTDGLKYNGYPGFLKVLRPLPPVGTISTAARQVEIRYAYEQAHKDGGRRLVLVADQPLFFLAADPAKPRAGYELTIVELIVDGKGGVTGTMAGAARVKPGPDGVPILDNFAEIPVRLEGKLR